MLLIIIGDMGIDRDSDKCNSTLYSNRKEEILDFFLSGLKTFFTINSVYAVIKSVFFKKLLGKINSSKKMQKLPSHTAAN